MTIFEPVPTPPTSVADAALSATGSQSGAPAAAGVPQQQHRRTHEHGVRCYWDFRDCRWVCTAC